MHLATLFTLKQRYNCLSATAAERMLLMSSPSCLRATACAFSQVSPTETVARRRKETAYTKCLKLKTLPEKVVELEKACFSYRLAILHLHIQSGLH